MAGNFVLARLLGALQGQQSNRQQGLGTALSIGARSDSQINQNRQNAVGAERQKSADILTHIKESRAAREREEQRRQQQQNFEANQAQQQQHWQAGQLERGEDNERQEQHFAAGQETSRLGREQSERHYQEGQVRQGERDRISDTNRTEDLRHREEGQERQRTQDIRSASEKLIDNERQERFHRETTERSELDKKHKASMQPLQDEWNRLEKKMDNARSDRFHKDSLDATRRREEGKISPDDKEVTKRKNSDRARFVGAATKKIADMSPASEPGDQQQIDRIHQLIQESQTNPDFDGAKALEEIYPSGGSGGQGGSGVPFRDQEAVGPVGEEDPRDTLFPSPIHQVLDTFLPGMRNRKEDIQIDSEIAKLSGKLAKLGIPTDRLPVRENYDEWYSLRDQLTGKSDDDILAIMGGRPEKGIERSWPLSGDVPLDIVDVTGLGALNPVRGMQALGNKIGSSAVAGRAAGGVLNKIRGPIAAGRETVAPGIGGQAAKLANAPADILAALRPKPPQKIATIESALIPSELSKLQDQHDALYKQFVATPTGPARDVVRDKMRALDIKITDMQKKFRASYPPSAGQLSDTLVTRHDEWAADAEQNFKDVVSSIKNNPEMERALAAEAREKAAEEAANLPPPHVQAAQDVASNPKMYNPSGKHLEAMENLGISGKINSAPQEITDVFAPPPLWKENNSFWTSLTDDQIKLELERAKMGQPYDSQEMKNARAAIRYEAQRRGLLETKDTPRLTPEDLGDGAVSSAPPKEWKDHQGYYASRPDKDLISSTGEGGYYDGKGDANPEITAAWQYEAKKRGLLKETQPPPEKARLSPEDLDSYASNGRENAHQVDLIRRLEEEYVMQVSRGEEEAARQVAAQISHLTEKIKSDPFFSMKGSEFPVTNLIKKGINPEHTQEMGQRLKDKLMDAGKPLDEVVEKEQLNIIERMVKADQEKKAKAAAEASQNAIQVPPNFKAGLPGNLKQIKNPPPSVSSLHPEDPLVEGIKAQGNKNEYFNPTDIIKEPHKYSVDEIQSSLDKLDQRMSNLIKDKEGSDLSFHPDIDNKMEEMKKQVQQLDEILHEKGHPTSITSLEAGQGSTLNFPKSPWDEHINSKLDQIKGSPKLPHQAGGTQLNAGAWPSKQMIQKGKEWAGQAKEAISKKLEGGKDLLGKIKGTVKEFEDADAVMEDYANHLLKHPDMPYHPPPEAKVIFGPIDDRDVNSILPELSDKIRPGKAAMIKANEEDMAPFQKHFAGIKVNSKLDRKMNPYVNRDTNDLTGVPLAYHNAAVTGRKLHDDLLLEHHFGTADVGTTPSLPSKPVIPKEQKSLLPDLLGPTRKVEDNQLRIDFDPDLGQITEYPAKGTKSYPSGREIANKKGGGAQGKLIESDKLGGVIQPQNRTREQMIMEAKAALDPKVKKNITFPDSAIENIQALIFAKNKAKHLDPALKAGREYIKSMKGKGYIGAESYGNYYLNTIAGQAGPLSKVLDDALEGVTRKLGIPIRHGVSRLAVANRINFSRAVIGLKAGSGQVNYLLGQAGMLAGSKNSKSALKGMQDFWRAAKEGQGAKKGISNLLSGNTKMATGKTFHEMGIEGARTPPSLGKRGMFSHSDIETGQQGAWGKVDDVLFSLQSLGSNYTSGAAYMEKLTTAMEFGQKKGLTGETLARFADKFATRAALRVQNLGGVVERAPIFSDPVLGTLMQFYRPVHKQADYVFRQLGGQALKGNGGPLLRYILATGAVIEGYHQAGGFNRWEGFKKMYDFATLSGETARSDFSFPSAQTVYSMANYAQNQIQENISRQQEYSGRLENVIGANIPAGGQMVKGKKYLFPSEEQVSDQKNLPLNQKRKALDWGESMKRALGPWKTDQQELEDDLAELQKRYVPREEDDKAGHKAGAKQRKIDLRALINKGNKLGMGIK